VRAARAQGGDRRPARARAVSRPQDLSRRRHQHQGRPREHGALARGARAADGSPAGRVAREPAVGSQDPLGRDQVPAEEEHGGQTLRRDSLPAQDGLRRAARPLVPRAAARARSPHARRWRARRVRLVRSGDPRADRRAAFPWTARSQHADLDAPDVRGVPSQRDRRRGARVLCGAGRGGVSMRILHVLDHSLPLHSGYAFRTAAILREQRRLGWDTRQLTTPRHGRVSQDVSEAEGWHFDRTPLRPNALAKLPGVVYVQEMAATARRIQEIASEFHPDILHAHSPVLNALPALWAGRRLGIPVVYEVRASWEDAAVDHGVTAEGSLRYRASRALETFAMRHADRITTICDGLRDEIAARGVSRDRITVIPNAVDSDEFALGSIPDASLRAELGLDG